MADSRSIRLSLRGRARLVRRFVARHSDVHDSRPTLSDIAIAAFGAVVAVTLLLTEPLDAAAGAASFALLALALGLAHRGPVRREAAGAPSVRRIARAWYPFIVVPLTYAVLPYLNTRVHGGRYFDTTIQALEQSLFGMQPAARVAEAIPYLWISEPLHAAYLSYYLLIWGPALLCYLRGRMDGFVAARDAFVLASLACFLFFVFVPVQGPRYLWAPPAERLIGNGPLRALTHAILERGSSRGAAFPSGHVAVAVAQAVVAWRFLPGNGMAVAATAFLLAIGTVYGGFHYAVDSVAGAAVGAGAGLLATQAALRRFRAGGK